MRALIQRVEQAKVEVDAAIVGQVSTGLVVFLGVGPQDDSGEADYLANKIANLRVFADERGKMNLSVRDIRGQILAVPQFTLYGDCRKGRRPDFTGAAPPQLAESLFDHFVQALRAEDCPVETGVFQAHMQVSLVNDGPVTLWLVSRGEW